jgi:hypothetical protein
LNQSSTVNQQQQQQQQNFFRDPNFTKYRTCFKNSLKELDFLLKDFNTKQTSASTPSSSTGNNNNNISVSSSREDRIHGFLLIILEIVKFSGLEFEQQLEKYLSKYNLYHQQSSQTSNNAFYVNNLENNYNNQQQSTSIVSGNASSFSANSSLIENTAKSCKEMHAANLLKLLPHSCFDPLHANDPFMFLFKLVKISVNIESKTCAQMVADSFDSIMNICLNTIRCLNLSNATLSSSSSSSTTHRCIQETIMALLPRLARFNQKKFTTNYLKDTLAFLTNLNNNTTFLPTNISSSGSTTTSALSTSNISVNPIQSNNNSSLK